MRPRTAALGSSDTARLACRARARSLARVPLDSSNRRGAGDERSSPTAMGPRMATRARGRRCDGGARRIARRGGCSGVARSSIADSRWRATRRRAILASRLARITPGTSAGRMTARIPSEKLRQRRENDSRIVRDFHGCNVMSVTVTYRRAHQHSPRRQLADPMWDPVRSPSLGIAQH